MPQRKHKIIVVLGQTACGKSDLAVNLAKKFTGEVISADSRQVYRGLNLGSGKITIKEMKGVPHHMLDVASPLRTFSVAKYQKLARLALRDIFQRNRLPIICGGTGLYIDALIYDYNFPAVKPNRTLRQKLEKLSSDDLFHKLLVSSPERIGNIDRHNRQRLIRALEIAEIQTVPVTKLHKEPLYNVLKIGRRLPNNKLKKNIHRRLVGRLRQGLVAEVAKLRLMISDQRLESFGLEYRWITRYLKGDISRTDMLDNLERDIGRYAKRQMTWFKRDKEIIWLENYSQTERTVRSFLAS